MADRLKEFREKLSHNQTGVADVAGIAQGTWSRWEKKPPEAFMHLIKVCQKYEVSADYLLGILDDPAGHRDLVPDERVLLKLWRDLPTEQQTVLVQLLKDGTAASAVLNTVQTLANYNAKFEPRVFGGEGEKQE